MTHHYKFMYPLYSHMEAFNIIIMNEHRRFHLLITPHMWSLYIICIDSTLFALTPSTNFAHSFVDYQNTSNDCINFSIDCAHNSDDCANIPNDRTNIVVDLANTLNILSLDLYIPNPSLLQLLFIHRSKIKVVFTLGFVICSSFSTFFICGFCISHLSSSSFVSKFASWTPRAFYYQYIGICCSFY